VGTPNTGATTNYNFTVVLEHAVPEGGELLIEFPVNYYTTGLGLPTRSAPLTPFDCYIPYPTLRWCTVDGTKVHVPLGGATAGSTWVISIDGVKNPPNEGGAAAFVLSTRIGINIIDQNKHFASIGFIGSGTSMTSGSATLDTDVFNSGSNLAGEQGTVVFTFSAPVEVFANGQFRF
jgi:hypothetical protein